MLPHGSGELLDLQPRADEEEVVATGEDGIGVACVGGAVGGQPQAEEVVHLSRQRRHFGEAGRFQAFLEDAAEVIDVAFQGGDGDFAVPAVVIFGLAFFAGEVVEGFGGILFRSGVVLVFHRAVFVAREQVFGAKARHVGVDVAACVAVPDAGVVKNGQGEIPAAAQFALFGGFAKVTADLVVGGEGDGVAEDVQPQFLGVAVFVYRSGAVQDE